MGNLGACILGQITLRVNFYFEFCFLASRYFLQPVRFVVCLFLSFAFFFLNACLTNKGAEWWAVGICLISYWSSCWGHVQCRAGQEPAENSPWSDVLKPLGLSQCTALCSADCKLLWLLSSLWQINHCLSSCRGAQVGNVVAWKWTLVLTWWGLWDHYLILYTF